MKSTVTMKKAIIACLTVAVLGIVVSGKASAVKNIGDGLVLNPTYEKYLDDVAMGRGDAWTVVPRKYVQSRTINVGDDGTTNLPSSYSLISSGFGTEIKNQAADSTCWAYSLATTLESTLKKSKGVSIEISPKQLDYLAGTGTPYSNYLVGKFGDDALHQVGGSWKSSLLAGYLTTGDYTLVKESDFFPVMKKNDSGLANYSSFTDYQDDMAAYRLMGMLAFGVDNVSAYSKPMSSSDVMSKRPPYVITKYTNHSTDKSKIDAIKERIYNNGAVYIQTSGVALDGCWDEATETIVDKGIYVCGVTAMTHSLSLVGWDDNYAYTDPADGTQKQGAFLAQNTWGPTDVFSRFVASDYHPLAQKLVSLGVISSQSVTEQSVNLLKYVIEEYDEYNAYEYVHFAYDYDDNISNGSVIEFVSLDDLRVNEYSNVYDVIDTQNYEGGVLNEAKTEEVFTFVKSDNKTEPIASIGVGNHGISFGDNAITYEVYIDTTGTGENYELFGSANAVAGDFGQVVIDTNSTFNVTGNFKVKLTATVGENAEILRFVVVDDSTGTETDLDEYFTVSAYAKGEIDEPDDPTPDDPTPDDPTPDDPIPDDPVDPDVPSTGLFTKELRSALGVISCLMMVAGGVFVVYKVYQNRKSIFHKVKFNKKY